MNMLELRLICDNIKRFGGFRELNILDNLKRIELMRDDENYKIYRFVSKEQEFFEYDFKSHRITN